MTRGHLHDCWWAIASELLRWRGCPGASAQLNTTIHRGGRGRSESPLRDLYEHLLPNLMGPINVYATLTGAAGDHAESVP